MDSLSKAEVRPIFSYALAEEPEGRWNVIINKFALVGFVSVLGASFVACESQSQSQSQSQSPEPAVSEPAESPPPAVLLSTAERLDGLKLTLEEVKTELNEKGEYNCCVQPSCSWCALHEGSCECFNNIQEGEAVCPGCGLGWHNGEGVVDGVDSSGVQWNITHEHPSGGHEH